MTRMNQKKEEKNLLGARKQKRHHQNSVKRTKERREGQTQRTLQSWLTFHSLSNNQEKNSNNNNTTRPSYRGKHQKAAVEGGLSQRETKKNERENERL